MPEKYQPTPEEIQKAEEMMEEAKDLGLGDQKKMSEEREATLEEGEKVANEEKISKEDKEKEKKMDESIDKKIVELREVIEELRKTGDERAAELEKELNELENRKNEMSGEENEEVDHLLDYYRIEMQLKSVEKRVDWAMQSWIIEQERELEEKIKSSKDFFPAKIAGAIAAGNITMLSIATYMNGLEGMLEYGKTGTPVNAIIASSAVAAGTFLAAMSPRIKHWFEQRKLNNLKEKIAK